MTSYYFCDGDVLDKAELEKGSHCVEFLVCDPDLVLTTEEGQGRARLIAPDRTAEYRAALLAAAPAPVAFDTVRAARARGGDYVREVLVMLVGRFPLDTKEHVAARQQLLGPILEQNAAIGAYLRLRRAVEDVNPDTGDAEPPAAPAAPPVAPPAA